MLAPEIAAVLLYPFLPQVFRESFDAMGREAAAGRWGSPESFRFVGETSGTWDFSSIGNGLGDVDHLPETSSDGWWKEFVPTHGNFAGPGYACGERKEFTEEQMRAFRVARVDNPRTGEERDDIVDGFAQEHDIKYYRAEQQFKIDGDKAAFDRKILEADRELAAKLEQALADHRRESADPNSTSKLIMTEGELNYSIAMYNLFKLKIAFAEIGLSPDEAEKQAVLSLFYPDVDYEDPFIAANTNTDFIAARNWIARRDPLAIDLDNDGIETVGIQGGSTVLFDHDGDGVKTGTGWVKGDDGFLVLDRNNNGTIDSGSELFSVDTVLGNGQKAADGFSALRELDSNADGKFTASDALYNAVKVWQDTNQDGISQAEELKTLASLGITSIDLNAKTAISFQHSAVSQKQKTSTISLQQSAKA